jgi:hypothetical protein
MAARFAKKIIPVKRVMTSENAAARIINKGLRIDLSRILRV